MADPDAASQRYDVVVVGAGQAGLALGYQLRAAGLRFVLVEAGDRIGRTWASRWDSLRLFTPAQYCSLPETPFPAPPDTYPAKDQVADYLAEYARRHELPVRLNTRVQRVVADDKVAGYVLETEAGRLHAHQVVLATGPFQVPYIPSVASGLDARVTQLHSCQYQSPTALPAGRILVVGGGNSGYQIAAELAATHPVDLAVGRHNVSVPQRPLGRDIFWWQVVTRLINVKADSGLGRRMRENDQTVIGISPKQLRELEVTFRPRVVAATGRTVQFADDTSLDVDTVLWATGFWQDHSWVDIPAAKDDATGRLRHQRGVTPAPGLYVLGLPWLHTTGSALLGFVKNDAAYLADQITARTR
ncbi:SidA/IucD/PvdA family monooxygenase [Allosaccharopolyspora coralli]|uniref:SidA/IucD/PvdA family monooxygenase n=1 Tax=Allosaccharopolyspora coralli TaxID=2665642 RepID=A0A5Q3Q6W2_9PSEU|nr:NAD(P)/FAD-dependent oxidoreductase [Allosaccharopolyspora coralli]QGK70212.1 SidA/IucD/PvdA family monooxygenase [Allosaccharopolyspora coralli]